MCNPIDKIKRKIFNSKDDFDRTQFVHNQNDKLVFTNGCFDILHRGHVEYLAKAANMGTSLVIGLNTDTSVRKLKGADRPINDQYSRAFLLAAMEFVAAVVLFDEDTPYQLIKICQPDILVKGADYQINNIVGADIVTQRGGQIKTIEFVEGFSTTSVLEKIKKHSPTSVI
ncbi:MAG: D-glycero-beta-D-manno-heptose 1-phosphate adenylyltransferase [Bacteroidales bacterium]|jgi:rfaE bifunctional protein nucleotidyltransferase chain/domain|nr:D-glycero-beta-D-manno-heptose 1-phosphate adenylyltransferase [Bacteroidales bacterium]